MSQLQELRTIMAKLRSPDGCPWDKEQTHQSICDCMVEEVSELLDTLDRNDMDHMKEELGDLLMHIFFHAQIAEENNYFTIEDVAEDINKKMIRRHPHVFGDTSISSIDALWDQWEAIKEKEKANKAKTFFKDLPPKLPALIYAKELYRQIQKKNLDASEWVEPSNDSVSEEEIGRALFQLAAVSKENNIDPESALRRYTSQVKRDMESKYQSNT